MSGPKENALFVDALRDCLGLAPIYTKETPRSAAQKYQNRPEGSKTETRDLRFFHDAMKFR